MYYYYYYYKQSKSMWLENVRDSNYTTGLFVVQKVVYTLI